MSTAAWLWYLTWRKAVGDARPSDAFLDALYDKTSNPILRLRVVEIAVGGPPVAIGFEDRPFGWIHDRISGLIEIEWENLERPQHSQERDHIEDALELLAYLIDLGDDRSLRAGRVLLTQPWVGHGELRERASALVARMQLSDEEDIRLRRGLGLSG
jgi:hypothetical protein